MLRVQSSLRTNAPIVVQTDFYVPIEVVMEADSEEVATYWRTGDHPHSLVEVGIDPPSGRFRSVTIPLASVEATVRVANAPVSQPTQPGVPTFDTGTLRGSYTDERGVFFLRVGPDVVWLDFAPGVPHVRELRHGPVRFLLGAEDAWLGVVVEELTERQLSELWVGVHREGSGA